MKESDIEHVRQGAYAWVSKIFAGIILLASLGDIAYTTHYIITEVARGDKLIHMPIPLVILIFTNMWFINNIRLKASIFLFGHIQSDNKIVSIAGDVLSALGNKLNNK